MVDGTGEGEVKAVAGDAAALVQAVGLEVEEETVEGLDECWAGGGIEEEKEEESVGVRCGSVGVTGIGNEGGEDGVAGDGGMEGCGR